MIHVEKRDSEKKIKSYDRKEKEMSLVSGQTQFYWHGGVLEFKERFCTESIFNYKTSALAMICICT